MENEADFLKLAESINWKLDLLLHSGLDLQEKLNEIPGWQAKWEAMDSAKRKKALTYIFKQIGYELYAGGMTTDFLFTRLFQNYYLSIYIISSSL